MCHIVFDGDGWVGFIGGARVRWRRDFPGKVAGAGGANSSRQWRPTDQAHRIRLRDPTQARALEKWLLWIAAEFHDRLLPVDDKVADQWGRLGLHKPVPVLDAFLAATAQVHELRIVSRDEEGFRNTGVTVINPFSKSKHKGN